MSQNLPLKFTTSTQKWMLKSKKLHCSLRPIYSEKQAVLYVKAKQHFVQFVRDATKRRGDVKNEVFAVC